MVAAPLVPAAPAIPSLTLAWGSLDLLALDDPADLLFPAPARPLTLSAAAAATSLARLGAGTGEIAHGLEALTLLPADVRGPVEALLVEMAACEIVVTAGSFEDHGCAARLAALLGAIARAPPAAVALSGSCEPIVLGDASTGLTFLAIGGSEDNCYDMGPTILSIDLGGNDIYNNPAGVAGLYCCSRARVSIAVDFAGDDLYAHQQGSGYSGIGILLDLLGDDAYRSMTRAENILPMQASANLGVGLLWDLQGNDAYECLDKCQGFGWQQGGAGILWDDSGDDSYILGRNGQGYGGSGALGFLYDGEGNDDYSAYDQAQGMAWGEPVPKGHGALVDRHGDDAYSLVYFGRAGFGANGVALFADLDGVDTYVGPVPGANNARWGDGVADDGGIRIGYDCTTGQVC